MKLKDDIASDIDKVFMNKDEFAVEAVYYENGVGNGRPVAVLFDKDSPRVSPESGELLGSGPAISVKTLDVPNLAHKDTFKIETITYRVDDPGQDDGYGMTDEVRLIEQ